MIDKLKKFYKIYGEGPKENDKDIRPNEKILAKWISTRRQDKKNRKLSIELETQIMTECPWFSWDPLNDNHIKRIKELKEFYEEYGEGPKDRDIRPNGRILASWIGYRRKDKKNGKLSIELE
jgi:hypothetical protein